MNVLNDFNRLKRLAMTCLLANTAFTESRRRRTPPAKSANEGEISAWQQRAEKLLSEEISFVMHDSFRQLKDAEAATESRALAEAFRDTLDQTASVKKVPVANVHYQRMCSTPLLTPELESACFRHFNWLKFRANVYRSQLDLASVDPRALVAAEQHLAEASVVRNLIVQANCRLAVSIVRKYSDSPNVFDELMSEAIATLIGAAEKFDYSRGFRFSTYATQSIQRRLFRILSQRQKQRTRFLNNSEEAISTSPRTSEDEGPKHGPEDSTQVQLLLTQLDQRERLIVELRFGIQGSGKKHTFVEIGKRLKISKERVRQLAERALLKLRTLAGEYQLELA